MELEQKQERIPGVVQATARYESWLARRMPLWHDDLEFKHTQMASSPFMFNRATYYRWVQRWLRLCPDEASAPAIPAVGDIHVQNFGTWRDREGRLVWGINDFDEAAVMPYTIDLARLASSARLALKAGALQLTTTMACEAILDGYTRSLEAGGRPLVLAEKDRWLRKLAGGRLREPGRFWSRIDALPKLETPLRSELDEALRRSLPRGFRPAALRRRRAGAGSLGHERACLDGELYGYRVAREVKSLPPAAWAWVTGKDADLNVGARLVRRAVRAPDPYLVRGPTHAVRRLAPDCTHLDLADMPTRQDDERLLRAMGWETANVHLGHPRLVPRVLDDLRGRPQGWLEEGARRMVRATMRDWKEWRLAHREGAKVAPGAAT